MQFLMKTHKKHPNQPRGEGWSLLQMLKVEKFPHLKSEARSPSPCAARITSIGWFSHGGENFPNEKSPVFFAGFRVAQNTHDLLNRDFCWEDLRIITSKKISSSSFSQGKTLNKFQKKKGHCWKQKTTLERVCLGVYVLILTCKSSNTYTPWKFGHQGLEFFAKGKGLSSNQG